MLLTVAKQRNGAGAVGLQPTLSAHYTTWGGADCAGLPQATDQAMRVVGQATVTAIKRWFRRGLRVFNLPPVDPNLLHDQVFVQKKEVRSFAGLEAADKVVLVDDAGRSERGHANHVDQRTTG